MNHMHFPFTLLSVPQITPLHLQLMKHILQQILPMLRIALMKSRRILQRPPSQFFHNAFLREIDLYWSFARPLLKENSAFDDLQQFSDELIHRWEELKRFIVLVSNVESLVCSSVLWTVDHNHTLYPNVNLTQERVEERIKVGLDLYMTIVMRQRTAVDANPSMQRLKAFAKCSENFLQFLQATAQSCWDFINCADHAGYRSTYSAFENRLWDELQCAIRLEDFEGTADNLLYWREKPYRYLSGSRRPINIMFKVRQWVKEYTERHGGEESSFASSSTMSSVDNE